MAATNRSFRTRPSLEIGLKQVLPANVAAQYRRIGDYLESLYPEERGCIAKAVERRRREFATGRLCAREALSQIGITPCAIPVGPLREPIWPCGVAGSITHDGGCAIAAVARASAVPLLGLDLTVRDRLDASLVPMICTDREIRAVGRLAPYFQQCDLFKVIFCLKESAYKCLFPTVREIFDFMDATVHLEHDGRANIVLAERREFYGLKRDLQARYCVVGNYILSAVWIDRVHRVTVTGH